MKAKIKSPRFSCSAFVLLLTFSCRTELHSCHLIRREKADLLLYHAPSCLARCQQPPEMQGLCPWRRCLHIHRLRSSYWSPRFSLYSQREEWITVRSKPVILTQAVFWIFLGIIRTCAADYRDSDLPEAFPVHVFHLMSDFCTNICKKHFKSWKCNTTQ